MKNSWKALLASILLVSVLWDYDPASVDVLEESTDGQTWTAVIGPYQLADGELFVVLPASEPSKLFRVLRLTPGRRDVTVGNDN